MNMHNSAMGDSCSKTSFRPKKKICDVKVAQGNGRQDAKSKADLFPTQLFPLRKLNRIERHLSIAEWYCPARQKRERKKISSPLTYRPRLFHGIPLCSTMFHPRSMVPMNSGHGRHLIVRMLFFRESRIEGSERRPCDKQRRIFSRSDRRLSPLIFPGEKKKKEKSSGS